MGLKIKTETDAQGIVHVPPDAMDLLVRFAQHRDLCDECLQAVTNQSGTYCPTGASLFNQLLELPSVEYVRDV